MFKHRAIDQPKDEEYILVENKIPEKHNLERIFNLKMFIKKYINEAVDNKPISDYSYDQNSNSDNDVRTDPDSNVNYLENVRDNETEEELADNDSGSVRSISVPEKTELSSVKVRALNTHKIDETKTTEPKNETEEQIFHKMKARNFRTNVLKTVFDFSEKIRRTLNRKLLDFVRTFLSFIKKVHVEHNDKFGFNYAKARDFQLNDFLTAVTSDKAREYAAAHPDDLLTLNYKCFTEDYDCDFNAI